jgi:pyruvate dehydrogenase E2 component (dihydrolipoamide acetyltransferase)
VAIPAGADRVITGADIVTSSSAPPPTPARAPVPGQGQSEPTPRSERRRSAIAELMTRSWHEIPHYHVTLRIDLSRALEWLTDRNAQRSVADRIVPAALLLKASAVAAVSIPGVNGWWVDGGFVPAEHADLGVAVALRTGGLITPTLQAADELPLPALMSALNEVVGRVRRGRLRRADTAQGSITVTNLGDLGVDSVLGIIHPPQVGLVGFGAIHDEPVARDGMVGVRRVVHASFAGDHRAGDGLAGARILATIASLLEQPELL